MGLLDPVLKIPDGLLKFYSSLKELEVEAATNFPDNDSQREGYKQAIEDVLELLNNTLTKS